MTQRLNTAKTFSWCAATVLAIALTFTAFRKADETMMRGCNYVSDRPDLSGSCAAGTIENYVKRRADNYFSHNGIAKKEVSQLKMATTVIRAEPLVLSFSLSSKGLRQLLKNAVPEKQSFADVYADLYDEKAAGSYSYWLKKSPYKDIGWWPPTKSSFKDIRCYTAKMTWRVDDSEPGNGYLIFVDQKMRQVWIIGQ